MKTEMKTVKITDSAYNALRAAAAKNGQKLHFVASQAIQAHCLPADVTEVQNERAKDSHVETDPDRKAGLDAGHATPSV